MTEEIIIDGVNVAGCYADKKKMKDGLYCFWEGGNCEYNKYCYYKECKRLEQKNRELKAYKDVNEDFKKAWDELNKKYTEVLKLAKENADSNEYCLQELEKKNFALTQESQQKSQTICELKQENEVLTRKNENRNNWIMSLRKQCGKLVEEKLIYRSALEEIDKILDDAYRTGRRTLALAKIRDRINEVLNENQAN